MVKETDMLIRSLRDAGLSNDVIRAAWPPWWSEELADDPSGQAELRFALSRRLGLSPRSLMGERVEFIWNDEARFKHLSAEDAARKAVLASFGVALGRQLIRATETAPPVEAKSAEAIREAILENRKFVDLQALLGLCWGLGIPVIYLRVFPLQAKSMHAMVVAVGGRYAILLGRDASYPAPIAFTLAHEIGHVMLGHLADAPALVDMENAATSRDGDEQENEADRFALSLLTGREVPEVIPSTRRFNSTSLAQGVVAASDEYGIEPGTLALCVGYQLNAWPVAMASLPWIYGQPHPMWSEVNRFADMQLDWSAIGGDASHWLRTVMGARE